jgi:hypothetical protein
MTLPANCTAAEAGYQLSFRGAVWAASRGAAGEAGHARDAHHNDGLGLIVQVKFKGCSELDSGGLEEGIETFIITTDWDLLSRLPWDYIVLNGGRMNEAVAIRRSSWFAGGDMI